MMATPSPPPPVIARKPLAHSTPRLYAEGDFKENMSNGHKPLPAIPISSLPRVHGTPMFPLATNIQREKWLPTTPSETVGNGNDYTHQRQDSAYDPAEQYYYTNPNSPLTKDLPFRPEYPTAPPHHIQPQIVAKPFNYGSDQGSPTMEYSPGRPGQQQLQSESMNEYAHIYEVEPVPQFQYHHQRQFSDPQNSTSRVYSSRSPNIYSEQMEVGESVDRHLTPTSQPNRRTPIQRPASGYSDFGPNRGRSPAHIRGSPSWGGQREPSVQSGRSNEAWPMSYVDLTNSSYPQAPPPPISLNNSQLRSVIGSNASLLSTAKTIEMYRQNVKKLSDVETQYAFAIFLIQAAQEAGLSMEADIVPRKASPRPGKRDSNSPYLEKEPSSPAELVNEAKHILQKLSDRSYPFAQYYLADGYASGLFSKGKEDYGAAFPLFVSASKHGHAESGYRAALCYEFGWGCRKDLAKAVQFYRQSASKNHPGAMTRLGRACLSGELGMNKYREGLKWLKRATESADLQYNAAPYHLALLYETGYGDDVFQDEVYTAQLFTQAADLGHAESCYRLGDAYEHGKLSCPRDPALSVHFYTGAAERGHPAAMMALCAWYMVGAEPILEKDENEAYEWALQAAECGLTKAEYAVGYFTEMGIGTRRDPLEANVWYVRAADSGDERAKLRLAAIRAAASGGIPMEVATPPRNGGAKIKKSAAGSQQKDEKECVIM